MSTTTSLINVLTALTLALPATALAGDLTPPAGPVAPTMKTLDQVEPRIPVQSLPPGQFPDAYAFEITNPGHYYLTGDVITDKAHAIRIAVSDVTLDLAGFTVRHEDSSAYSGITIFGSRGVVIRDGRVSGFGAAIAFLQDDAVGLVEDVEVSFSSIGIQGKRSTVRRCLAQFNTTGFLMERDSLVEDSRAMHNTQTGISSRGTVLRSMACRNGGYGIAFQAASAEDHGLLSENTCDGNGAAGIWVSTKPSPGSTVRVMHNRLAGNSGTDLIAWSVGSVVLSNLATGYQFMDGAQASPVQSAGGADYPFANIQF
jgi:hypothetical protein